MKRILIWLIGVIFLLLLYYFELPPINLSSPLFWHYILNCLIVIFICMVLNGTTKVFINKRMINKSIFTTYRVYITVAVCLFALLLVINVFSGPIFNAKEYGDRIVVDSSHDFITDVKEVDFTKTPLIDKDSSQKLGDRKMGEFTSMVSQFYVSDLYTQINYNSQIIRVTPLEYAGFIKYMVNHKEGIKGYISVNSVDGTASFNELEKGMKYMPSAYFFDNLYRKLRFTYPTLIFDDASFEIDNDGNPYWIIPYIKYKAIGLKKEIAGVVILDPITGKSNKYSVSEVPTWVDHVYSADLIIDQINDWGNYKNGFLNSIFGQKDVINTTDGYNYLVMDDDVYLYTGITSVSTDESNLGFVLVNLRTKDTHYYLVPGAEEYSAMASAKGQVQEKNYTSSFPLLINLNNKPTYLLSLKDSAGLVKMYAFIDVTNYQKVVVSDASLGIEAAAEKYLNENYSYNETSTESATITVKSITSAIIDSNTYYYITDIQGKKYYASIKVDKMKLPFVLPGESISIKYINNEVSQIVSIEK